jgi:tetratricopeptide (TPR) repeat protein
MSASRVLALEPAHRELGDLKGALEDLERARDILAAVFGEDHHQVAGALRERGATRREMGDLEGALEDLERGQRILCGLGMRAQWSLHGILLEEARVHRHAHRFEAGIERIQRAIGMVALTAGPLHHSSALCMIEASETAIAENDSCLAWRLLAEAGNLATTTLEDHHPFVGRIRLLLEQTHPLE